MKPIEFPGANIVFAKDQPQYLPLPAKRDNGDPTGKVTTCWKLTAQEINHINKNQNIFLTVLTFHNPLQPILASVLEPGVDNCPKCGGMGQYYSEADKSTVSCVRCNGTGQFTNPGTSRIYQERCEQIYKHGFDVAHDQTNNKHGELKQAVAAILNNDLDLYARTGWDYEYWDKIKAKPELEQLAICGALIAAEIDRLTTKIRKRCLTVRKKHVRIMREKAIELMIATVELATAKTELEALKLESGGVASEPEKYTEKEVNDLLVDFGNYLLSDKRAGTIEKEENRKNVTDADLSNWADENDQCNCPVCQMRRAGLEVTTKIKEGMIIQKKGHSFLLTGLEGESRTNNGMMDLLIKKLGKEHEIFSDCQIGGKDEFFTGFKFIGMYPTNPVVYELGTLKEI